MLLSYRKKCTKWPKEILGLTKKLSMPKKLIGNQHEVLKTSQDIFGGSQDRVLSKGVVLVDVLRAAKPTEVCL